MLVCDFNDRSLYILVGAERECSAWKSHIEAIAFNNSAVLQEQQVTGEEIPVIVDKVGAPNSRLCAELLCAVCEVRVHARRDDRGDLPAGRRQHQDQPPAVPVPQQCLGRPDQPGGLQVSIIHLVSRTYNNVYFSI